MNESLTVVDASPVAMQPNEVLDQIALIHNLMNTVMQEGEHYGTVPGCGDRKVLFKVGAEKLSLTFRLIPRYSIELRDLGDNHREYVVTCTLTHQPTGAFAGEGIGSCSTMESKYRYRNAAKKCPECDEESIIAGKAEYGGGWLCFRKRGGCGAKFDENDKRIVGQPTGKIDNPDIADQYNTVLKMGAKRALVHATIQATAAGDIFVQDIGDREEYSSPPADTPEMLPDEVVAIIRSAKTEQDLQRAIALAKQFPEGGADRELIRDAWKERIDELGQATKRATQVISAARKGGMDFKDVQGLARQVEGMPAIRTQSDLATVDADLLDALLDLITKG